MKGHNKPLKYQTTIWKQDVKILTKTMIPKQENTTDQIGEHILLINTEYM